MADVDRLLELMHPMREPPQPAAITPYLATVALGCLTALALYAAYRVVLARRSGLRRAAQAALAASRDLVPQERLAAQATLLRRLVRSVRGEAAARAEGPAWLSTLDATFGTQFFTAGDGAAYGHALYARTTPDVEALDRSLDGLIAKLQTPHKKDGERAMAEAR